MVTYPQAAWKPVPNHGGAMSQHLGLVLHVQQGNNGLQGWFSNPESGASSTWWVSKTGQVEQYVDAELQAWAQAAGNSTYNSVETEGYDTEALTQAQMEGLAGLYRWGHDTYGWPFSTSDMVGQPGFAWHGMGGSAWGGHPACPGDLRKNARTPILQMAMGSVITPTPPTPQPPQPQPTFPPFPYPPADYLGQPSPDPHCHSGFYGGVDQQNVRQWQNKMLARGWSGIGAADGMFGPNSEKVCRQFQSEKQLAVDGKVGPNTWAASWTAPIT